jgi:hypothetical protein
MAFFSGVTEFVIVNAILYLFCAVVAFAVSFFSYRAFKITKERNFLFFALGFFILAIGIIAHSIGNFAFFIEIEQCFFSNTCTFWQRFFYLTNLIFVAFSLYAYNLFIFAYSKIRSRVLMFLAFIESSVIALFLFKIFWFYVVASVIILFLVFLSGKTFFKNKNKNSLIIFIAFILLFISNILFALLTPVSSYLGHAAEFFSFLLFLVMLLRVKYIKTKKKSKVGG